MHKELDHYVEQATLLDEQLASAFGRAGTPLEQPETASMPRQQDVMDRVTTQTSAQFPGSRIIPLSESNVRTLSQQASGRLVALMRHEAGQGRIYPAIIEGANPNGGMDVSWVPSRLPYDQPYISGLVGLILHAAIDMHRPGVGSHGADTMPGVSPAAETGHTYMGLRAVTDPTIIAAVQAGIHPVHSWASTGVVETVTQRQSGLPGMFDVTVGGTVRQLSVCSSTLQAGGKAALLHHPSYEASPADINGTGLEPARLALGVGIVAAAQHTEKTVLHSRDAMFNTLERM